MQSDERVSVIITTYKRPVGILSRAAESVLTQTWKDLELILVNDWPEDRELAAGIRRMVEELGDGRVRLIEHARNLGSNAARNTGLAAAQGEYVAFLDDDDTWTPEKLERQLEAFRRFPEAAMVYGSFDNEERDGSVRHVKARPPRAGAAAPVQRGRPDLLPADEDRRPPGTGLLRPGAEEQSGF